MPKSGLAELQILAPEADGQGAVAAAQQVLGEIEPGVGEETGAGHPLALGQLPLAPGLGDDAAIIPNLGPEGAGLGHRPVAQRRVIGQRQPAPFRHPGGEGGEVGPGDTFGRRCPEWLCRHGVPPILPPVRAGLFT